MTRGNRPGFAKNIFSISMYENQPINTVVESIGFDGLMTFYTVTNETACANDFQINPFTGVITSKVLQIIMCISVMFRELCQEM